MDPKPTIGRIVHYYPNEADTEARTNGATLVPAIVVAAWGGTNNSVNLKVFTDGEKDLWRTSVQEWNPELTEGTSYWTWPERK